MKNASSFRIVLVTAPNRQTARKLARAALQTRAAACANIIPALESHYWWKGKIESSKEVLIVFKTTRKLLGKLEEVVLKKHPYDTPEFVALPLSEGNEPYLEWLTGSTK